jgi:fucose 4-O-acetylase-like acetyltransferase
MNQHDYDDLGMFFAGAFAGITFILTLSRMLELLVGHIGIFQFVAQNTLFIMAFHLMIMSLVNKFILDVLNISSKEIAANGYVGIVVVIPTLILLIPLIHLCNRYFPLMVGKSATPKNPNTGKEVEVAIG